MQIISAVLFLFSCKAVHKSTDTTVSASASISSVSGTSKLEKNQVITNMKRFSEQGYITTDSGYEKVVEETVYEYEPRQTDSLWNDAMAKVIQTNRVIREKGSIRKQQLQQTSGQDSLRQNRHISSSTAIQTATDSNTFSRQTSRSVQRTGTPWYVWGGGVAIIAAMVWWKRRQLKIGISFSKDYNQEL